LLVNIPAVYIPAVYIPALYIPAVYIPAVAARQVSRLNTNITFMAIHRSCPLARARETSELIL
jgi:hypothetical protein